MAQLYMALSAFLILGVVWFYLLRPALVDWGWIVDAVEEDLSSVSAPSSPEIMSRTGDVPGSRGGGVPPHSQAGNALGNRPEHGTGTPFRSAIQSLEHADDTALLDILAAVRGADGEYRFAESRIAKFVGGRIEDRIIQVRRARHLPIVAEDDRRTLLVRDRDGERTILFDE